MYIGARRLQADFRRSTNATVIINIAALLGSSLWFSVNAVADSLHAAWGMTTVELGYLTSVVQFGFIIGSLSIALSGLADRFSASRIFAVCAVFGALTNAMLAYGDGGLEAALVLRFITGLALAGIYPIGMKLVVSWAPDRAGHMLGWMVGMLVVGSGLPHLIRGLDVTPDWRGVLYIASIMAVIAGLLIWRLGDGPHHAVGRRLRWDRVFNTYSSPDFRAAAFGYFGHMWELYAFFALAPLLLARSGFAQGHTVYLTAFAVFFASGIGCIAGGILSRRWGGARIAIFALGGSALMCLTFPWVHTLSGLAAFGALLAWGILATTDSPQFSALAARACPPEQIGGALAMMNSIGFAISIVAIEVVTLSWDELGANVAWLLLPGPLFGLFAMRGLWRSASGE